MPLAIACLVNFNVHADALEWDTGVMSAELPKEAVTALPLPVEVGNMVYVSIMLTGFIVFLGLISTMVTVWKEYVRPSINQLLLTVTGFDIAEIGRVGYYSTHHSARDTALSKISSHVAFRCAEPQWRTPSPT